MNITLSENKASVLYSCIVPESSITDISEIHPFFTLTLEGRKRLVLTAVGFKKAAFS